MLRLRERSRLSRVHECGSIRWRRAVTELIALVFDGGLALRVFVFLVVVGLDDVAHDWPRGGAAMLAAFLHENGDDDFRIAARSVADEPGVVFKFFLFAHALSRGVADNLRSAGFSAEFDTGKFKRAAGATFVDHTIHGVSDFLDGGFRNV